MQTCLLIGKTGLPLFAVVLRFEVIEANIDPATGDEGVELPDVKDGALVHGIFMEACRWDAKVRGCT